MGDGSECGGCRGEERYLSDLGEVENSDQEDIVDEGADVDDQLLSCNISRSARNGEDDGCLCQRGRVELRGAVLLDCALGLVVSRKVGRVDLSV